MRILLAAPFAAGLVAGALAGPAFAAGPDPMGIWMRGDGNARVRMAPCGSDICAINLWIKDPSGGEAVGDKLVMSVKPKDDDTLAGEAYDAKRNLTYSMEIKVEPDRLSTRGCVIGGLICRNVSWSRVD
ncbi:MAG: hypothetical protein B7Y70_01585 [Rhizobiales bacterium 35-68-8]|nr:MAG: hypothetical protein B7Y70_01585 [Rhizobiales bacterium 35-68-8]